MKAIFPADWRVYVEIASVFLRLLGLFILVPVFSHRSVPGTVKLLLAVALSYALFPVVRSSLGPVPETLGGLAGLALRETAIGFCMGFVAYLTFEAIHLAAQFVGFQMGFGVAGLVDPLTQSQVSVLVPMHGWVALMVFLVADLHHDLIYLFVKSFEVSGAFSQGLLDNRPMFSLVVSHAGRLFALAVQMAAPVAFVVLACNAAIGVLARMMPQMNIILFSFPVTILLGLCSLYVIAPDMLDYLQVVLGEVSADVLTLLRTI